MTAVAIQKAEQWRPAPGFPRYAVSDSGRVLAFPAKKLGARIVALRANAGGYRWVGLYDDSGRRRSVFVHVLVLLAFVGPRPEGQQTRHLNGIRHDNRVSNLAWGTPDENMADRVLHGRGPAGEGNGRARLTESSVREMRRARASGESYRIIAGRFGVSPATASQAIRGRRWRHVS